MKMLSWLEVLYKTMDNGFSRVENVTFPYHSINMSKTGILKSIRSKSSALLYWDSKKKKTSTVYAGISKRCFKVTLFPAEYKHCHDLLAGFTGLYLPAWSTEPLGEDFCFFKWVIMRSKNNGYQNIHLESNKW